MTCAEAAPADQELTGAEVDRLPPAEDARQPPPDFAGWLGVATLGIVVFDAYQFCRAGAGAHYAYRGTPAGDVLVNLDGLVSVFFLLSAVALYSPLARAVRYGEAPDGAGLLLVRRLTRILPLYWCAVTVLWCYRNPGLSGDWRDLVEHLTFTQVFDSKRIFYTIGPVWSLSVEVFFCAFLALAYWSFGRWQVEKWSQSGRWVWALALPSLLLAASWGWLGWAVWMAHEPADRWAIWFNPLAKAGMFAAGMFLALWFVRREQAPALRPGVLLTLRGLAAALLIVGLAIRTDAPWASTTFGGLSTVAFALLLASSFLAPPSSWWRRLPAKPALLWLGMLSYSMYVWHEPVLLLLYRHLHLTGAQTDFPPLAGMLVILSVGAGWLSYWCLEYPAGHLRGLIGRTDRLGR